MSNFVKQAIEQHAEDYIKDFEHVPYVVFLCRPAIAHLEKGEKGKPEGFFGKLAWFAERAWREISKLRGVSHSATLRKRIKDELKTHGFDVVLGEDDGLENARLKVGRDAQDNELKFITDHCNAVVVVAGSPGSFCEVGLFSWHFVHPEGVLKNKKPEKDFVLLVDKRFEQDRSYFNEGPA